MTTFETLADVASFAPGSPPNWLETVGYEAVNDGGGGVFHRPAAFPVTLGPNPFSMTSGSSNVTVTHERHRYLDGSTISIAGATAAGGITINGSYTISVLSVDTYQITHGFVASSTTTGGGSSVAVTLTVPGPLPHSSNFHRAQDSNGNWYERLFDGRINAQAAGIFGALATDVTDELNDLIAWIGSKGGGTLVLPPGIVKTTGQVVVDVNSIEITGSSVGSSSNTHGTTWSMAYASPGAKCLLGGDGVQRNLIKISRMKITVGTSNEWCFRSRSLRQLEFEDIQCNIVSGFLYAGEKNGVDGATADNMTIGLSMSRINTTFYAGSSKGFLQLQNCQAPLALDQSHIEGSSSFAPAALGNNPFSMTNTSAVVTVTHTAHGFSSGFWRTFSGATAAGGITINGLYQLTVTGVNSYTITHASPATSTTTGGGASVAVTAETFGIKIPVGAERTDGAIFTGFNLHYWHVGYDLRGGFANWQIQNAYLDGMFSRAFDLRCEAAAHGLTVVGIHMTNTFNTDVNPIGIGDIAVDIEEHGAGTVERLMFANCPIFHWGRGAFNIRDGSRLKVVGCHMYDCTVDADNTYDVITLGSGLGPDCDISGNTLGLDFTANNPRYGINIDTSQAELRICNNTIGDCQTATINNPNRGSTLTRKIYGNSGQVFEGQIERIGPFVQIDAPASTTKDMELVSGHAQLALITAGRRCRIVGWEARVGNNPSGGTTSMQPKIGGAGPTGTAVTLQSGTVSGYVEDLAGISVNAGNSMTVQMETDASWAATTNEIQAWLHVAYD